MGRHGENIRKRRDGRWEGRYKVFNAHKNKNTYRSVYGRTYGEVKEKLAKAKSGFTYQKTMNQGTNLAEDFFDTRKNGTETDVIVFFSQAAEEWLEEVARKRKYSTYVKYNTIYKTHLSGRVGTCQLSATTAWEFQTKIFNHLTEGNMSEILQKSIY